MEFLLIASAHFLALLSPGPDFFLILQTALRLPLRYTFAVCGGIALANGCYVTLAVLGLESIRHLQELMYILRYFGAAYLVYIGLLLLRAPMQPMENNRAAIVHAKSLRKQFTLGLMSGLLNPKNIIFYLSLFTAMVSPRTSLGLRALYGLWMSGLVLGWDMGVAVLLGNNRIKSRLGGWIFGLEKFSGIMLTLFGILLAID